MNPPTSVKQSRRTDLWAPVLAVSLAVAGLLLATEMVVRWLAPEPVPIRLVQLGEELTDTDREVFVELIEPDSDLFWRLVPDIVLPDDDWPFFGRISNHQRLREDHEIPLKRPKDELRLLFLGASGTFGFKLPLEASVVDEVERLLRAQLGGHPVECINAGVPGYGLFQGWQLLRREGFDYEPDLVVVNFGWNDATERDGLSDIQLHALQQAMRPPVLADSRLMTLIWQLLRPPRTVEGRTPRARLWSSEYRDLLATMHQASLAHDADFLSYVSASSRNIAPGFSPDLRTGYQKVQYEWGRDLTLRDAATPAVFDTVPLLQDMAKGRGQLELYFADGSHPRRIVNERMAEAFVEQILPWAKWRLASERH